METRTLHRFSGRSPWLAGLPDKVWSSGSAGQSPGSALRMEPPALRGLKCSGPRDGPAGTEYCGLREEGDLAADLTPREKQGQPRPGQEAASGNCCETERNSVDPKGSLKSSASRSGLQNSPSRSTFDKILL